MLIRLFTLGFDPVTERFNDEPVRDFLADKAVEAVRDHFFVQDRQLAEVVNKRPATLAELGQIDGFGDAKLKNYGREILEIIARAGAAPPEADHAGQ